MKNMKRVWPFLAAASLLFAGCSSSGNDAANYNDGGNASSAETASSAEYDRAPVQQEQEQREDVYFQDYGTHPFVSAEEDSLSTFAIDVDTGAYTIARSYIENGSLPPAEAVRIEEYVNAFDMGYEPPAQDTFAIHVDTGASPFEEDDYELVRIGIKGKEVDAEERQRANLTFVIDISGSMDQENRIGLVQRSLETLIGQLNDDDRVGIVAYGSTARELLPPTEVANRYDILEALYGIEIEGATNVEEGLLLGYEMAEEGFDPDAINRIILCSDGVANVGETGPEGILEQIEEYAEQRIYLSTFGFGMDNYNDVLMEQLADNGDGAYAYIDDMAEAKKVFRTQLTGTLQTIARDAKIQVDFDSAKVEEYRLLGYENRAVADEDFRDNRVDGGEVGAGHSVTALYAVKLKQEAEGELGHVTIRFQSPEDNREQRELSAPIRLSGKLSDETLFLAAVAKFADVLKASEPEDMASLREIRSVALQSAEGEEQEAFVELLEQAMKLRG
ncbi:vWA domain-containing protein [Paenibacillus soyae]|uniref:von Willebrand factor type A domain-containing protein n=1 Tax=Paenibacillus soyae TaxID=2969249 RepID=A0A9X2MZI2_9BACL|nr:von Willebrand factor type A domain-containing protein [Paenibacillus soyae]MCR2806397.1 von Willebrand factor type A domain-containing protein [Paenibacillus soyae]